MNEANKPDIKEITIDIKYIINDLKDIYNSNESLINFLKHIYQPKAVDRKKRFIYRVEKKDKNDNVIERGEKDISFTEENSKRPTSDFKQIIDMIKGPKPTEWKKILSDACDHVHDANQQHFIQYVFIPKVNNPAAVVDDKARKGTGGDYESAYETLGKCMVFYSGKAVSRLADIDTKISKDKFQEILQGCFGSAPNAFGENENFLSQFINPRAKLMIDAAKCALYSISQNGDVEIEEESYYNSFKSILPMLFEVDNQDAPADFIELPKKADDFVRDDMNKALIQAKNVAKKYPRQYKIWFDRLEAAFNKGLREQQEEERKSEKTGEFKNPLTNKIERRHGKAWGTGGPNGFIRDNEYLQKIVNDIKGQQWNMFNCGPKIILGIFDAIEHGGKIYQKLCDDLGDGFNQVKHSFNKTSPEDFYKLIDKYKKDGKGNEAYTASMASVICALTSTYQLLGQGKIGTINVYHKTITTNNVNNTTVIQNALDNLQDALERQSREETDYEKWKKEKSEEIENRIKKTEEDIKGAENNKQEQPANEPKKESWKPVSMSMLLKEEEEKKKQSDIEKEIEDKKEELEKLKKSKGDKLKVNLDSYFALLDGYAQAVGHEPEIADIYQFMIKMFDADRAKEQEAKIYNKEEGKKEQEEQEENIENASFKLDIKDPLLTEAETVFSEEEEESNDDTPKTDDDKAKDTGEMKGKRGNLDWIQSGAGESFIKLYKLFGENTGSVHLDLSKIRALSKDDNQESTLKDFGSMCRDLRNSLNGIDVRPITDGIIAFDYAFGEDADKAQFNTLANAFNIEGVGEAEKENKAASDKKKEADKAAGKITAEELTKKQDELTALIGNGSKIMKTVSSLTEFAKNAKDDSWLSAYDSLIKETDKSLDEIWDKCLELYPEGNKNAENGRKWILDRRKDAKEQVFLNRIWYTLSCAKYIVQQISGLLEKNKEKKESLFITNIGHSRLDEAGTEKVSKSVNTLHNKLESIEFNFSDLLATDIKDPKYDITKVKEFNAAEQDFANRLGMKGDTNDNHVFPMCRTVVLTDNAVSKAIMNNKVKIPCKKLAEQLQEAARGKGLSTKSDRDVYLLYGLTVALTNALYNGLDDDDLKAMDCGNPSKKTAETEKSTAGAEENQNKANLNASYIPAYSKDSLINEIYKYLKG